MSLFRTIMFLLLLCMQSMQAQQQAGRLDVRHVLQTRPQELLIAVPNADGAHVQMRFRASAISQPAAAFPNVCTYRSHESSRLSAVLTIGPALGAVVTIIDGGTAYDAVQRPNAAGFTVQRAPYKESTCSTPPDIVNERIRSMAAGQYKQHEDTQSDDTLTIDLAIECDGLLAAELGSEQAAREYTSHLVAVASAVYEQELNIRLRISNIRVWGANSRPYDPDVSVFGLLDEFVSTYESTMTQVDRDIAVIITARGAEGGVARSIGGLCEKGASYCAIDVVGAVQGFPTWSWDTHLLCHELGHICGGIHTQSCYWQPPLDSCYTAESGMCYSSEDVRPTRGTIMSYCSKQLSNGGTIALEFHPRHRSVLRAVVAQARCSNTSVPVVDTNALVVIVRDENGRALQGVTLEISIADKALIKTRAPEIKQAVLTTDSAGRARFSGLGHTVYQVDIHKPYIRTMFDQMETDSSVRVIVDSSQTSLHVTLAKAVALRVRFDGLDVGSAPVVSAFRSSPTLRADIIECRPADIVDPTIYEHYLLPGSYVIAPSLMGKKFIPQSQRIEVHPDSAAVQTKFTAEETAETAVSIVIGSGFAHRTLLPSAGLTGGDTYELYDTDSGKTVATGVVPATGVAVAEEMSALAYYGVRMKIDTATYAPWYQQYSTIVPLLKQPSMLSVKRERLRPLLARSYVFSRKAEAFSPLFTPVILQDQLNARATTTSIDVPFELPTGGSTVAVHRNGFVTFGSKRLPRYTLYPLSMTDDVDAIISPLGTELVADTNAPNPWHVGYEIQGIAPNRTLVIEWQELSARVYDPETGVAKLSGRFTFQLRIYEVGTIEFVYKRPVALTYPVSAQIGIRGADVLDNSIVALQSNSAREAIAGFEFEGDHLQMINELTDMPSGLVYRWSNDHVSVANENVPRLSVAPIVDGITITSDEYLQHVRLYSLVGNLVHERTLPGTRLVISMRDLPAGIYTIVATGEHSCNVQTIMHLVR